MKRRHTKKFSSSPPTPGGVRDVHIMVRQVEEIEEREFVISVGAMLNNRMAGIKTHLRQNERGLLHFADLKEEVLQIHI